MSSGKWRPFCLRPNVFSRCDYLVLTQHDDVIKWNHFSRYWPFVREIHRSRWVPRTKASDAELWCRNNWQKWRDTTSASRLCDVTGQAWRRHDGGLEKTVLGENSDDPDSKVDGANMGHTWGRQDPGGPHVGPMNFTIIWGAIDDWFQWDSCVQGIK